MSADFVTLRQIAEDIGMDRSHLRRFVIDSGIEAFKVRIQESQNQQTLAVSCEDAEKIKNLRRDFTADPVRPVAETDGYFYMIRLVPELAPSRIKFGFTNSLKARLSAIHTAAPTAEIEKWWPCKRYWEKAAIDCATLSDSTLIGGEVYEFANVAAVRNRLDDFFAMLPIKEMWSDDGYD